MPKKYTLLLCVIVISIGFFAIYPTLGVKYWVKSISQREVQSDLDKKSPKPDDMKNVPTFDKDNIKSSGVAVDFKHWPLTKKEEETLLRKAEKEGFKGTQKYPEVWYFSWDKEYSMDKGYPQDKSEKVCEKFRSIPFVDRCQITLTKPIGNLLPESNHDRLRSNGIGVFLKHWPLTKKEEETLLRKAEKEGFKGTQKYPEVWYFSWDKEYSMDKGYPQDKSEKVCEKFRSIPFVDRCIIKLFWSDLLSPPDTRMNPSHIKNLTLELDS